MESRVNGEVYSGACACLLGTIANLRDVHYTELPGLRPDGSSTPERWFLAINEWMSYKHPIVAVTIAWIDEWTAQQSAPEATPA